MKRVGIRDLKSHLSAYVNEVRQGERVIVTDRGVAVAQIVPLDGDVALQRLIDAGLAMPPRKKTRSRPTPWSSAGPLSDLVSTQRE